MEFRRNDPLAEYVLHLFWKPNIHVAEYGHGQIKRSVYQENRCRRTQNKYEERHGYYADARFKWVMPKGRRYIDFGVSVVNTVEPPE